MIMAPWMRSIAATGMVLLAIPFASADAAKPWNRTTNIKSAATHLAQLQASKGALGAYEFISACYQTHRLAAEFSAPLEACLVQDYIHSKITAAVYERLPPEERSKMGLPSPKELVEAMLRRFGNTMAGYKFKEADARKLIADIDKHGIPEFTKTRFPAARP